MDTSERASRARTETRAESGPAYTADDEHVSTLPPEIARHDAASRFLPEDDSLEAIEARADANAAARGGFEGARYDPVTNMRIVEAPDGRGGHRKQRREVRSKADAQATGAGDFYEPGKGWVRRGVKRETDPDAKREDNVFYDDEE